MCVSFFAAYLTFLHAETIRSKFEAFRVWVGSTLYVFITKAEDMDVRANTQHYLVHFKAKP